MVRARVLETVVIAGALAASLIACSSSSRSSDGGRYMAGNQPDDVIHLTNGEEIRGKIIDESPSNVTVQRDGRVSVISRGAVYNIDYSRETYAARTAPPLKPAPTSARVPTSSWYPRSNENERVDQTEVLWFETHPFESCVGPQFADTYRRLPEMTLFAVPGGKIVFHDVRLWGYHAHLFEPAGYHKPVDKPGLRIPVPEEESELARSIAFVSPAQEMKSVESPERTSYAIPDAIYARLNPFSQAEGMLAAQPFAGGKPMKTAYGTLWAFSLPRSNQFYLYLLDPEKTHAAVLKNAFVAYSDTILAADAVIDMEDPDGAIVGRVLVVPFPDQVSADGPAPEPVIVYTGPTQDPTEIARVTLPPRHSLQLPPRPPSTKADVYLNYYEVSQDVPQSVVVAYGADRPTGKVTMTARELTPQTSTQHLRLDLSSLPAERFPAVVWLSQRRTFAWRETGGYLPPVPALSVPPRAEPKKLTRIKRSDPIPHVLPILFYGPKGAAGGSSGAVRGSDPAAGLAGGMSSALMADALNRESGGIRFSPTVSSTGGPGTVPGVLGSGLSNTTNVTVVVPPHEPTGAGISGGTFTNGGGGLPPAGRYLSTYGQPGRVTQLNRNAPMGAHGHIDHTSGIWRDPSGRVVYDPEKSAGYYDQGNPYQTGNLSVNPVTRQPVITITRRRR